jgi:hypothetical protein
LAFGGKIGLIQICQLAFRGVAFIVEVMLGRCDGLGDGTSGGGGGGLDMVVGKWGRKEGKEVGV